jgi:leucyl aminopeptidase (aminopeptidase T)
MSADFRLMEALQGARNCAITLADAKRDEKIVIIADTHSDTRIAQAVMAVLLEIGADPALIVQKARPFPHEEPPEPVAQAMKAADLIFCCTYQEMIYAQARLEATKSGARYIEMVMDSVESMCTEGARYPIELIFETCRRIFEQWRSGETIHVTCDKGSDLTAQLQPQNVVGGPMKPVEPGTFEVFAGGTGDVGMWPAWTAEGVLVFDCVHTFIGRLKTPTKLFVEGGQVVRVEGDAEQVTFFEGIFEKFGDGGRHIGELMIGLNPKARIFVDDPTHLEAHRHAGCLHVATGMSIDFYEDPTDRTTMKSPTVDPGIHLDHLIIEPTIKIDDEVCVEKGRLKVLDHPDLQAMAAKYGLSL